MLAFRNDDGVKDQALAGLQSRRQFGALKKNRLSAQAPECFTKADSHRFFEQYGIPPAMLFVMQHINEGLPTRCAENWFEVIFDAIPVGVDLSGFWREFATWLLTDEKYGVLTFVEGHRLFDAIRDVAWMHQLKCLEAKEWQMMAAQIGGADEAQLHAQASKLAGRRSNQPSRCLSAAQGALGLDVVRGARWVATASALANVEPSWAEVACFAFSAVHYVGTDFAAPEEEGGGGFSLEERERIPFVILANKIVQFCRAAAL